MTTKTANLTFVPVVDIHKALTCQPMACMAFYRCVMAGQAMISPQGGDCCVFCSYGNQLCPVSNKQK